MRQAQVVRRAISRMIIRIDVKEAEVSGRNFLDDELCDFTSTFQVC